MRVDSPTSSGGMVSVRFSAPQIRWSRETRGRRESLRASACGVRECHWPHRPTLCWSRALPARRSRSPYFSRFRVDSRAYGRMLLRMKSVVDCDVVALDAALHAHRGGDRRDAGGDSLTGELELTATYAQH